MVARRILMLFIIAGLFSSCTEEVIPPAYKPRNAFDVYAQALKTAGLEKTALGEEWFLSAEQALLTPLLVTSPFKESLFLDPVRVESVSYQMYVKRGQKISISITIPEDSQKVFIDLFRVEDDSLRRHVASADTVLNQIGFEPRRDSGYILRVQPELLRGGRYEIEIRQVPTLQFPVAGKNSQAIGSFFGDPRDGGKRDHHGVDIFARKRTPVLAPSKAYVRNVSTRGLGGKVVWLYDSERRISMYFAHLDSQIVKENTYLQPGDTLGLVGNTGNAKYTPPHLHFGIYANGPIDPINYLKETDTIFSSIDFDADYIGQTMRVTATSTLHVRQDGILPGDTLAENQLVYVAAGTSNYYRVRTFDGHKGYISSALLEPVNFPVKTMSSPLHRYLFSKPGDQAIGEVFSGDSLEIYGSHDEFQMVRIPSGKLGWIIGG